MPIPPPKRPNPNIVPLHHSQVGNEESARVFAFALLLLVLFGVFAVIPAPFGFYAAVFLGSFAVGIGMWRWLARDDGADLVIDEKPKRGVIDGDDLEKPKRSDLIMIDLDHEAFGIQMPPIPEPPRAENPPGYTSLWK